MYLCNYTANWLEGDSDDDDDYCAYESWKKVCMIVTICNSPLKPKIVMKKLLCVLQYI